MAESGSSAEESDGEGDNEDNQQVGIETHCLSLEKSYFVTIKAFRLTPSSVYDKRFYFYEINFDF